MEIKFNQLKLNINKANNYTLVYEQTNVINFHLPILLRLHTFRLCDIFII